MLLSTLRLVLTAGICSRARGVIARESRSGGRLELSRVVERLRNESTFPLGGLSTTPVLARSPCICLARFAFETRVKVEPSLISLVTPPPPPPEGCTIVLAVPAFMARVRDTLCTTSQPSAVSEEGPESAALAFNVRALAFLFHFRHPTAASKVRSPPGAPPRAPGNPGRLQRWEHPRFGRLRPSCTVQLTFPIG
eukprot:771507-Prorocentrum_minimum.AAC.1